MKSKKILLLSVLSALSVGSVVGISLASAKGDLKVRAEGTDVWSHYSAVSAGIGTKGIKEYWVSCDNHTHQFTAPDSANIQDKGAPSQAFIDALADNDDRLVPAYEKVMGFEDGKLPNFLMRNSQVTSAEVTDDGVDGSKALKVSVKSGDFQFGFDKAYLDAAFANSNVKAVAFDAMASKASENFRYNTPQGEPHATSGSQPFENYNSGANGISKNWKTFFFTRKMYNSWTDGSYMVKGSLSEAGTVYIDNVRPVTYDIYDNISQYGFETNSMSAITGLASGQAGFVAKRGGSNTNALNVNGAGVVADSWSYSYDKKTEGNRSVKFTKQSGYVSVSLETAIINKIPGDYVVFDLYMTSAFNSTDSNKGITDGMNNVVDNQKQIPGNKWITLAFKKNDGNNGAGSQITKDGRILTFGGSTACDIYIDNIRGLSKLDDFETAYAFNAGQYGYALDYKTETTESAGNTIRDVNKNFTFLVNGACCAKTELTTEKSSSGNYSVKYTWSGKGYCAMFINPLLLNMVLPRGFSVSFDIWASTSFTGGTTMGNAVNSHIGNWTTVTLAPSNFEYDSAKSTYNGRFSTANFNEAGTFYIDNFQLIAPAE